LIVFDALQPVPEARADAAINRIGPKVLADEEGSHFDAELPEADGNTWDMVRRPGESEI